MSFGLPLMVDGINYPSISDAARKYGFKDKLISERLDEEPLSRQQGLVFEFLAEFGNDFGYG